MLFFPEFEVDLNQYPTPTKIEGPIAIGDIHGNSQLLLYILVKFNIIEISASVFNYLVELINTPVDKLSDSDIEIFLAIIELVEINNHSKLFFLGDIFADRGQNDLFSLLIFKGLLNANVDFSIVISNHDFELIQCLESDSSSFKAKNIKTAQTKSLQNLNACIERGLIEKQQVVDLFQPLKAKYNALDYYKQDSEITLFSHASIDIALVKELASSLKTKFNDDTLEQLTDSIDAINNEFNLLIRDGKLSTSFVSMSQTKSSAFWSSPKSDPLTRLIWNRDYKSLCRMPLIGNYLVNYCHGHDINGEKQINVTCLDGKLGKGKNHDCGILPIAVDRRCYKPALTASKPVALSA